MGLVRFYVVTAHTHGGRARHVRHRVREIRLFSRCLAERRAIELELLDDLAAELLRNEPGIELVGALAIRPLRRRGDDHDGSAS